MVGSNEITQAEMSKSVLDMFNYVTQGTVTELEFDYVMLDEVELNFE